MNNVYTNMPIVQVDIPALLQRKVEPFKPLEWTQIRSRVFTAQDEYSTYKLKFLGGRWRAHISGYKTNSWYPTLWYAKWGIDRIRESFQLPAYFQPCIGVFKTDVNAR